MDYDFGLFTRPHIHLSTDCWSKVNNDFYNKLIVGKSYNNLGWLIFCCILLGLIMVVSCCTCMAKLASKRVKFSQVCIILSVIIIIYAGIMTICLYMLF